MIAVEELDAPAPRHDVVFPTVSEWGGRQVTAAGANETFVGDPAKRQNGTKPGQGIETVDEKHSAGRYFGRRRLVLRRSAANRVGDHAIGELKAIVRPLVPPDRKAEATQGFIEQIACPIAGEGPARSVRAAHAGSQTENQKPCLDGPERPNGRVVTERILPTVFQTIAD